MKVLQLWRYPIKSMLGEPLTDAPVGSLGVEGDRRRAVIDVESGLSLSAKRYGELLRCRARTVGADVMIAFPDGADLDADSPQTSDQLSDMLNRRVEVRSAQADTVVRHEFPTDIDTGTGGTFVHEPGLGAFFDCAPIHLLTTATLEELGRRQPASTFVISRFRPNIVVGVDGEGFFEDKWIGSTLRLGSVPFTVVDRMHRCVMTTRAQGNLSKDPGVLRAIAQHNGGSAGIAVRADGTGIIRLRDRLIVSS